MNKKFFLILFPMVTLQGSFFNAVYKTVRTLDSGIRIVNKGIPLLPQTWQSYIKSFREPSSAIKKISNEDLKSFLLYSSACILTPYIANFLSNHYKQYSFQAKGTLLNKGNMPGGYITNKEYAGNEVLVKMINENIIDAYRYKKQISEEIIIPNLLFVGPPGSGKTFLAQLIAKHSGIKFIQAPKFQNEFVSSGENNVVRFLKNIENEGEDAIVFIDEISSLIAKREHSISGSKEDIKTLNALLGEMDSIRKRKKKDGSLLQVVFIGAMNSSQIQNLDEAALRRFHKIIEIKEADENARKHLLMNQLENLPDISTEDKQEITEELQRKGINFSLADLKIVHEEAIRQASIRAIETFKTSAIPKKTVFRYILEDVLHFSKTKTEQIKIIITKEDFIAGIELVEKNKQTIFKLSKN